VLISGRVRYGGVQDGGAGHLPRRQGCAASRGPGIRIRAFLLVLQGARVRTILVLVLRTIEPR